VSLNKAMLIGRVGKDPEVRNTSNGNKVANFTLATHETWKNRDGEKQERTEWHRITVFGKLAETVEKWVLKGQLLYVEGQIRTRKYERNGADAYTTEIVLEMDGKMRMLGKGEGAENKPRPSVRNRWDEIDPNEPLDGQKERVAAGGGGGSKPVFDIDLDDDIPFLVAYDISRRARFRA
jgi:single-strand DNA-binding protein